mmetsp:Transcript_134815/g.340971  ORF Transcript_134815/g.340971 Transcript_134815/m.340971 type:complete len:99 (+) Transcript_134815:1-297(+)
MAILMQRAHQQTLYNCLAVETMELGTRRSEEGTQQQSRSGSGLLLQALKAGKLTSSCDKQPARLTLKDDDHVDAKPGSDITHSDVRLPRPRINCTEQP